MIDYKVSKSRLVHTFILKPNPSIPWKIIKKIYLGFIAFITIINIFIYLLGVRFALPFYFIETLILGYALYISCLKSTYMQIIRISMLDIEFHNVKGKKKNLVSFNRVWAKFEFSKPTKNAKSQVSISQSGKPVIVGDFLNEEEKLEFFRKVNKL